MRRPAALLLLGLAAWPGLRASAQSAPSPSGAVPAAVGADEAGSAALPASPAKAAETDPGRPTRLFRAGTEAFARGDFAAAVSAFEAARAAGLGGPAVIYDIGVCQYKLGRYADAEGTFAELAASYETMRGLAEYNRGLALTREGRGAEARTSFERARNAGNDKIAALADAMLARLAPSASRPGPAGRAVERFAADTYKLLDLNVGYDDNVALIDEATLPSGVSGKSPLLEVFGAVRERPRASGPLYVDGSAYVVRYRAAGDFDQTALRLGAGYEWDASAWLLGAEPYYTRSSLSGDAFERRVGAAVTARRSLGAGSLRLAFAHESIDGLDPRYDYVGGTRDRVSLDYRQRHGRGRLSFGLASERNDRQGPGVSPLRNELYAGFEYSLPLRWRVGAQGYLRSSRFDALAVPRSEDLAQVSLSASRDLASGWMFEGECLVGHNDSTDPTFSYDRTRFAFGLSKLF